MKRIIKVSHPENLSKDDYCQFNECAYELIRLSTYLLEDVTLTNEGLCFINGCLIEQSIHWYRDKMEIYRLTGVIGLMDFPTQELENSNHYLIIQGPVFNYFHWITESLPRLLSSKKYCKKATLILPFEVSETTYVKESLFPFVFDNIIYIPKQTNFLISRLIMHQIKPYYTSYNPVIISKIREFYRNFSLRNHNSELARNYKWIYLSNSQDEIVKIANEKEICCILKENDFAIIDLSAYSFFKQVRLMNNAEIVISSNQDLFACMMFLPSGSKVFELKTEKLNENDFYFERYWYLSSCLKFKYYYQFCNRHSPVEYEEISDLVVDIELFKKNLKLLLG
jgi:capsular polysaccharide biosynthesis protein